MKKFFSLFFLLTLASALFASPPEGKEWTLTFEDTFDGSQVDESRWFPAYRPGRKEYYQRIGRPSRWEDLRANYVLENGILKLRLDRERPKRQNLTDKCVSSMQTAIYRYDEAKNDFYNVVKFSQKYGYFEIRSRMPAGKGLHAAFWLTQVGAHNQEYQVDGTRGNPSSKTPVEIDIFELVGNRPSVNEFNVHFTKNGHYSCPFEHPEEFHVWGLEWEEGKLTWYLDGKIVRVWENPTPQHEMFLLLGMYQGIFAAADPAMDYPRDFEIDYVRVWQTKHHEVKK